MPVALKRSNPKFKRALVVSPYGIVQAMLKVHVSKHDVDTDRCASMNDALLRLKREDYDMVVLEIVKENILDGSMKERIRSFVQAFRAFIQQQGRETAIVVLSAQSREEFLREFDVEVDCVLDKRSDWFDKLSNFICPPPDMVVGMGMQKSHQVMEPMPETLQEDDGPEITIEPPSKKNRTNLNHQELL